jgi:hypothetical protein
MGIPIMTCRFLRAMTDTKEFDDLVRDVAYNMTHKYFTVNPCNHTPECRKLTKEEDEQIKLKIIIAAKKERESPNAKWIY